MTRKTLCVDFDGVLHSYKSGWQGVANIPDPPVPGALDFLRAAAECFKVAIFSSRNTQPEGVAAIKDWLCRHGLSSEWILSHLSFPSDKPAAWVILDDRAIQFTGFFPSLDEIENFKPWTVAGLFAPSDAAMPADARLAAEIMNLMSSRNIPFNDRLVALCTAVSVTVCGDVALSDGVFEAIVARVSAAAKQTFSGCGDAA